MLAICSLLYRLTKCIRGHISTKFTRLRAASHHTDGSYEDSFEDLHHRNGPIVKIGPSLLSGNDQGYFEGLPNLEAASCPTQPTTTTHFQQTVMSNIFRNEHLIDACNDKLFAFLAHFAQKNESVSITNMIARYAYEVMIATTTGRFAGFLEFDPDPTKVDRALKDWRFYAILYGSYLRYHPFIAKIRKFCGLDKITQDERFAMASEEPKPDTSSACAGHDIKPIAADIEARIALSLAGADPVMILILKAMQRIYTDEILLANLRLEIAAAELDFPVSFQQLVAKKARLRLMLSVLMECSRISLVKASKSHTSLEGGLFVGHSKVPQDATIILDPTPLSHVNSPDLGGDRSSWDPERWLDSSLASDMKHHLLAHNITNLDGNSITMYQILLGLKTCIHMTMNFTLSEAAGIHWDKSVSVTMADETIERDNGPVARAVNKTLRSNYFSGSLSVPSVSDSAATLEPRPLTPQDAVEFLFDAPTEIRVKVPPTATSNRPAVVVPIPTKPVAALESASVSRGGRAQRPPRRTTARLAHLQTAQTNNVASSWASFGNQEAQEARHWSTVAGQAERKEKIAATEKTAPAAARPFEVEYGPTKPSKNLPANMKAPPAKEKETKPTTTAVVPPHLRAAAKAKAEKESTE